MLDALKTVVDDAFDAVATDTSGVVVKASCASRMAMRLSWFISLDDIGFFRSVVGFFKVSCRGVFHAIVDDLDVAPVMDDAGVDASSVPGTWETVLNRFARIVAMFFCEHRFWDVGVIAEACLVEILREGFWRFQ